MDKQLFLEYCVKIKEYENLILEYKEKNFPFGCKVMVNADRYVGPGVVNRYTSDLPINKIPVKLENGNTWYYLVECCERADNV